MSWRREWFMSVGHGSNDELATYSHPYYPNP